MSEEQKQQAEQIIESQAKAGQFKDNFNTEFSAEEDVQESMSKSLQFQAKNQQPTFESNKPI